MESLGTGTSPTLHVRVTAVRKAQVQKLAEIYDFKPADIVRDAVDEYIKEKMQDPEIKKQLLSIARTTAE